MIDPLGLVQILGSDFNYGMLVGVGLVVLGLISGTLIGLVLRK